MAAPPVDCPAECGWRWASTYFGDCVCSDRDIASFVLGLASIAAWGVAELPQIWANFWAGKSEGISFAFIVTWLTARGQTYPRRTFTRLRERFANKTRTHSLPRGETDSLAGTSSFNRHSSLLTTARKPRLAFLNNLSEHLLSSSFPINDCRGSSAPRTLFLFPLDARGEKERDGRRRRR